MVNDYYVGPLMHCPNDEDHYFSNAYNSTWCFTFPNSNLEFVIKFYQNKILFTFNIIDFELISKPINIDNFIYWTNHKQLLIVANKLLAFQ
jgi:hypothetical protein